MWRVLPGPLLSASPRLLLPQMMSGAPSRLLLPVSLCQEQLCSFLLARVPTPARDCPVLSTSFPGHCCLFGHLLTSRFPPTLRYTISMALSSVALLWSCLVSAGR